MRLAEQVAEQIRFWAKDYRDGNGPEFRVYFSETSDDECVDKQVINKNIAE